MEPLRSIPPPGRPEPPEAESSRAALDLAGLLREAGYTSPRIQERLGTGDELLARSPELPSYLRRLGDADELAVLLRLLLLGVPVDRGRVEGHLGGTLREVLESTRFLVHDGDVVHGAARLVPHDELLIASDHAAAAETHADHVPGVHRPSVALAHLTVRRGGERALDLCAGNGIQAILLAAHAEHVVATDVNERALAYTRLNAALNGVDNVETRAGSFFEPVADEQFDLVVANPPYVVSPETAYLFRDGGMRGDGVSELVVRGIPQRLAPGAFASVLIAWALDPDDPAERPRTVARGLGLRRVPAPHLDGRPDRDRDAVEPRPRRPPRGLRRRARPLARLLPGTRDRAPRLRLPRAAQARRRPRGGRGGLGRGAAASPVSRSARQDGTWRGSSRRTTALQGPRPAGRCSTGDCASRTRRS